MLLDHLHVLVFVPRAHLLRIANFELENFDHKFLDVLIDLRISNSLKNHLVDFYRLTQISSLCRKYFSQRQAVLSEDWIYSIRSSRLIQRGLSELIQARQFSA